MKVEIESLVKKLHEYVDNPVYYLDTIELFECAMLHKSSQTDVRLLFTFIENYPCVDFGAPGPIGHFIEQYTPSVYELALQESVLKKPAIYSLYLLNRCINSKEGKCKERFIQIFKVVLSMDVDKAIKEEAQGFLDFQLQKNHNTLSQYFIMIMKKYSKDLCAKNK